MNRIEKKCIRLEAIKILDTRCMNCTMRNSYEGNQYCIKECSVGAELQRLSSILTKNEEQREPFKTKSGRWSEEEELYLVNHMKLYSIDHMAVKLNREPQAVYNKIRRLTEKGK